MEVITDHINEYTPTPMTIVVPKSESPSSNTASQNNAIRAAKQEEDALSEEFVKLNHIYQTQLDQLVQQGVMLFSTATQRCNYHKNRYSNVLAMEPTRVKLQRYMDSYIDSDYINANYINGEIPGSERAYISCQAPLSSTLIPFWLMIWEQNCAVIVMLTRLVERERPKAIVYWPENVGDTRDFGSISVTLKKTKQVDLYLEMRTFEVVCEGVKRQIVQFHYVEWPDFGVPDSTSTIRELICLMDLYRMKGVMNGQTGPVIAHCSAGVGRTGTFLAVHICMEKMKFYNSLDQINIPRTVMLLRQSRNGMVQTQEQYQFIYEVVKDARAELRERAQRVFATPSLASLTIATSTPTTTTTTTTTTTITPAAHHNAPTTLHTNGYRYTSSAAPFSHLHHLQHSNNSSLHRSIDSGLPITVVSSASSSPLSSPLSSPSYSNLGISFSKRYGGTGCKRNSPDTPTFPSPHQYHRSQYTSSSNDCTSASSTSSSTSSSPSTLRHTTSGTSPTEKGGDREVFLCMEKKRRLSFSTCN